MIIFNEIIGHVPTVDMVLHTSEAEKVSKPEPVEITLDESKKYLGEAVNAKGADYVYKNVTNPDSGLETCAYFDPKTKKPSCIVGHVLASKGVTFDRLDGRDRNLYTNVQGLIDAEIIEVDNETQALLALAQNAQDLGETWGDALEKALNEYEQRAKDYDTEGYDEAYDY
ncbi:hypothetical protein [Streptomyces sp. NPDC058252]|uniref:hypothetical protein n=1 Tax=Streptomyces sp. NPDC058252 TaxID=3346405 RepID=UPI0036E921FB